MNRITIRAASTVGKTVYVPGKVLTFWDLASGPDETVSLAADGTISKTVNPNFAPGTSANAPPDAHEDHPAQPKGR
jgi:hypothetical protein